MDKKLWASSLLEDNTFLFYLINLFIILKGCLINLELVSHSEKTSKDILQSQEVLPPFNN